MEDVIATDKNDVIIQVGDKVIWIDPEFTNRKIEYKVFNIHNEEMIQMSNTYGECEALPEECEVIWDKNKIDRWVEECAGGCAYELLDTFPFTQEDKRAIQKVENDDNISDSDFCDYILETAYNRVKCVK